MLRQSNWICFIIIHAVQLHFLHGISKFRQSIILRIHLKNIAVINYFDFLFSFCQRPAVNVKDINPANDFIAGAFHINRLQYILSRTVAILINRLVRSTAIDLIAALVSDGCLASI